MGKVQNVQELKAKRDIKGLVKLLGHEESRIRNNAAKALGETGDALIVPYLLKALGDERATLPATKALTQIGEPAVMPLIQSLKGAWGDELYGVIYALGEMADERAIEPLARILRENKEAYIRGKAIESLGKLGEKSVDALAQALKDERFIIRLDAAEALGKIKSERAIATLTQALKYEEHASVVSAIQKGLTRLKGSVKEHERGKCPICGTSLKFGDAQELKCYFCGVNLVVEQHKLVEQTSHDVTDSPQEKVVMYVGFSTYDTIEWPNCCCFCLAPVTQSDYYKVFDRAVLETYTDVLEVKQRVLEMAIKVPYCKNCHHNVKRLFGHREKEAVSLRIDAIGTRGPVKLTLMFRNPRYAEMFRQVNRGLIRKGKGLTS